MAMIQRRRTRARLARRNPSGTGLRGLVLSAIIGGIAGAGLDLVPRPEGDGWRKVYTYGFPAIAGFAWGNYQYRYSAEIDTVLFEGLVFAGSAITVANALEGARATGTGVLTYISHLFSPPSIDLGAYGVRGLAWDKKTGNIVTIRELAYVGNASTLDQALAVGKAYFGP